MILFVGTCLGAAIAETKANLLKNVDQYGHDQPKLHGWLSQLLSFSESSEWHVFYPTATADNNNFGAICQANSLYTVQPAATPAGTTKVNWVRAEASTTAIDCFATGYVTGKVN